MFSPDNLFIITIYFSEPNNLSIYFSASVRCFHLTGLSLPTSNYASLSIATPHHSIATASPSIATPHHSIATASPSIATPHPSIATASLSIATPHPSIATASLSIATHHHSIAITSHIHFFHSLIQFLHPSASVRCFHLTGLSLPTSNSASPSIPTPHVPIKQFISININFTNTYTRHTICNNYLITSSC